MTFRVIVSETVLAAINAQVEYFISESAPPDRIQQWLLGLFDRIDGLYEWPERFPIAASVSRVAGYEVRRMNHGEYALFFRIDQEQEVVEIIAFRHGRRTPPGDAGSMKDE